MKKTLLLIALLLPMFVFSQKLAAYRNVVKDGYNFWVYTPADYDSTKADKPLILFLHGKSLSGNDLSRVRRYGPLAALEMGKEIDAVIIAPQSPGGGWQPSKVLNVVNWVQSHYTTDTNRLYVLGMSMGGYGTINFVGTYSEKVAAAMALCGGGYLNSYKKLNDVPLWILHGTADKAVSVAESQKVVNSMASCGDTSLLRFTKLSGMNHSQLAQAFYLKETYEWLFSHSRADSVQTVNKSVVITPAIMSTAYQNINRNKVHITCVNGITGKEESATATSTSSKSTSSSSSGAKYYTIKKGDTLGAIAKKYHTTVDKLCKLNKMKSTTILQIGKKIRVK